MGCLAMKNNTSIVNKKSFSRFEKINIILTIIFSAISLGLGFVIAFFGNGVSFFETDLITAIITLFGFGLTATVFVYQAFEKSVSKGTKMVITALSKTLLLTLCLVVVALILDFLASLTMTKAWDVIFKSLKYAALIYSLICQFDILNSFIVIITSGKKDDSKKDE